MNRMAIVRALEGKAYPDRRVYIQQWLEAHDIPCQVHTYHGGTNLYVKSDREQTIGIGTHYDVVPGSPGANDNASAIAVAFDLLLRHAEQPLERLGLEVFFFDEEERGMLGSRAYLDHFGLGSLRSLINLELVGMGDRVALWPLAADYRSKLATSMEQVCQVRQVPCIRFDGILTHDADHSSFRRTGLDEALTLTIISESDEAIAYHYLKAQEFDVDDSVLLEIASEAPLFRHYHQSSDTSEHLDERALSLAADVVWDTIRVLDSTRVRSV
ncbi:MAG: hypothetical protein OHK0039_46730 [Bacteroidia bacterium]